MTVQYIKNTFQQLKCKNDTDVEIIFYSKHIILLFPDFLAPVYTCERLTLQSLSKNQIN